MVNRELLLAMGLLTAGVVVVFVLARLIFTHLRSRMGAGERLAAARGRCLSMAAEELRGPGLALMAQANLLRPGCGTAGLTVQLDSFAQHLLRLADDLSDLAAEPSPRSLHEAPALLGPVIDAAIANVEAQLRPGTRHWKVEPCLRRMKVRADGRALEGALAALLRRAARHSREGDVVSLRHVLGPETIAIVVEDEGDGLPARDLAAEAPSPGQGLRISRPNGTRGLDLGLTLARSLAVAHGGDIRLESAPGIGARAWLTLPRARLLQPA